MARMTRVNGLEIVSNAPTLRPRKYLKHTPIREALNAAPIGKWVVVPVPTTLGVSDFRNLLLQTLRVSRTGWKLTTRADQRNRRLFIARIA